MSDIVLLKRASNGWGCTNVFLYCRLSSTRLRSQSLTSSTVETEARHTIYFDPRIGLRRSLAVTAIRYSVRLWSTVSLVSAHWHESVHAVVGSTKIQHKTPSWCGIVSSIHTTPKTEIQNPISIKPNSHLPVVHTPNPFNCIDFKILNYAGVNSNVFPVIIQRRRN